MEMSKGLTSTLVRVGLSATAVALAVGLSGGPAFAMSAPPTAHAVSAAGKKPVVISAVVDTFTVKPIVMATADGPTAKHRVASRINRALRQAVKKFSAKKSVGRKATARPPASRFAAASA